MKNSYKVWVVLFLVFGLCFVIWSIGTPKNNFGTFSIREGGGEDSFSNSHHFLASLKLKVKQQSFKPEEEHQRVNTWISQPENIISTIKPVENVTSTFATKCPHCTDVANLVIEMMHESCHIDVTSEVMDKTLSSNGMYYFLMALKEVGGSELFERAVYSAKNSVNCEDDATWIKQTKFLIDTRLIGAEN